MEEEARLAREILDNPELWEEVRQLQAIRENLMRQVYEVDEATSYVLHQIGFRTPPKYL